MNSTTSHALADSYAFCERVTAQHGRTYYLAARLLPTARRRAVHALYAFARVVDDVVDAVDEVRTADGATAVNSDVAVALSEIERTTFAALAGDYSYLVPSTLHQPPHQLTRVLPAFTDAAAHFGIPTAYFDSFFASMRMDVPGTPTYRPIYSTMTELREYMYGSAVVIGLQLLPVLGVRVPVAEAIGPASHLAEAFQLTNFIRDIGEDLDRGRLYLPQNELAAFGVDIAMLEHGRRSGTVDPRIRRALAHAIALTRAQYRQAKPGIAMLDPRVQPSIQTAFVLYGAILDEVESAGYRILDRRVTVPNHTRLRVAVPALLRSATLVRIADRS